jgi:cytoskeletal protein RodZ
MREIGRKLREAREKKGMSLTEIQEITKIRLRYLEAIESGELDVIPGEVYRKGFISNYANAVGLDSEAIIKEYHRLKTTDENPEEIKPNNDNPVIMAENKTGKPQTAPVTKSDPPVRKASAQPGTNPAPKTVIRLTFKPGPSLFLTCGVLLLILLAFLFAHSRVKTNVAVTPEGQGKPAAANVKKQSSITPEQNPDQAKKPADHSDEPMTTQQIFPAPITVYAEFSSDVWIQLKSDGQMVYPDNGVTFTSKSPRQIWTARTEMVIRMGNPAGVKLLLNGKDLGPLGDEGIPKTITLTVNGITAP